MVDGDDTGLGEQAGNSGKGPEHLRPFQFVPGKSGNPKGRPRGRSITEALQALLDKDPSIVDGIAIALARRMLQGDLRAIELGLVRLEGLPHRGKIKAVPVMEIVMQESAVAPGVGLPDVGTGVPTPSEPSPSTARDGIVQSGSAPGPAEDGAPLPPRERPQVEEVDAVPIEEDDDDDDLDEDLGLDETHEGLEVEF